MLDQPDDHQNGTMILESPKLHDRPILVVDDTKELRDLMVNLLHRDGYRTIAADSGGSALLLLRAERPQLIITDLNMPGITGWKVLEYCREHLPTIPVLVVSGEPRGAHSVEQWAAGFISKPFDARRFRKEVALAMRAAVPVT